MRLPRDVSGQDLVRQLASLVYQVTRQSGSHMRLTRRDEERGEHHITIPRHDPLRVGTLSALLADVAGHLGITRADLVVRLFG